jgi:hypothetical protein
MKVVLDRKQHSEANADSEVDHHEKDGNQHRPFDFDTEDGGDRNSQKTCGDDTAQ